MPARRARTRPSVPGWLRSIRRWSLALAATLLLASALSGTALSAAAAKPSIVVVLTDDMEVDLVDRMPNVKALIASFSARNSWARWREMPSSA
jgi:hypothetical protein